MQSVQIKCENSKRVPFYNQVDYCVGTGRMGLALQKEYYEQLKYVQEVIGFKYIRGHGLFCDDMAIYQEREEEGTTIVEYNFTYLDRVMDLYQSLKIKPFLELGFMPKKLASGNQTVFYWQGNVTAPKDYSAWTKLVQTVLQHLIARYGTGEVLTWPIEVWNEPNLPVFWENADMQEYFRLFKETFLAVKQVHPQFMVGGPAVCGGSDEIWIDAFMTFCDQENLVPDFVSRHHYNTEIPKRNGHYGYAQLTPPEPGLANLHTTREIIDRFPKFKGTKIHITEFNTSYIPNCPLHDTNLNAAYLAHQLSRLGEDNESYSYWTFGDVFEEFGVPYTPFHGGFGLVTNGSIPKPTFHSFAFFKKLKEKEGICIHRDDDSVVMCYKDQSLRGVAWNIASKEEGFEPAEDKAMEYTLEAEDGEYFLVMHKVDETCCNPLKVWYEMGQPTSLTAAQTQFLKTVSNPQIDTRQVVSKNNKLEFSFMLPQNGVYYFELEKITRTNDLGYDYAFYCNTPENVIKF